MSEWQLSHLALASFSSLADYSSIKLTSEKAVKSAKIMTKDRKYLTSTQNLSEASFDFSRSAQKVKFTADIDIISYVICLADTTNKGNIMHWYNRVTRGVLAVELYAMTHRFDIEKRHWGRYQIVRKKSYQHQHYGMGETGEYKQTSMK